MKKGTVPKGWHLKPPPRYGAEPSSLMPHTQNRLIQVIRQCALQKPPSQMLLGQRHVQTRTKKEPGTRIASRLSLWLRRSIWIVIGIVPPKGRGRLWGNRRFLPHLSGPLAKRKSRRSGQLPQETASTKRKSTLPGALSFG